MNPEHPALSFRVAIAAIFYSPAQPGRIGKRRKPVDHSVQAEYAKSLESRTSKIFRPI